MPLNRTIVHPRFALDRQPAYAQCVHPPLAHRIERGRGVVCEIFFGHWTECVNLVQRANVERLFECCAFPNLDFNLVTFFEDGEDVKDCVC